MSSLENVYLDLLTSSSPYMDISCTRLKALIYEFGGNTIQFTTS